MTSANGGPDAEFCAFVDSGASKHLWLARVLTHDWQDAEDLLQEGLYRVFCAWRRGNVPSNPDAYLRATLVRLANRRARRLWHREVPTEDLPDSAAYAGSDETDYELLRAVGQLPPRQRAAVALRFLEDLSVSETSAAMGCTESTVKSLTQQALASLRQHPQVLHSKKEL